METKTGRIIQKLAGIGRILSKIIAICCIVGAIGSFVGLISVSVLGFDTFKVNGVAIHSLIEKSAEMSIGTMYTSMVTGMILCIGEAVIAKQAEKYFRNELAAGTPFTFAGAKEMQRLGICIIGVSLGTLIAAQVACAIINQSFSKVMEMHLKDAVQAGTGIAFILASLLCRYGAEREAENEADIRSAGSVNQLSDLE